jgi:RDD family
VRTRGYVVGMVIFASIAMTIGALAGALLLATTHWGRTDPSDRQLYTFFAIIGAGVPSLWTLLNLLLLAWRGQTGGQYLAGSRIRREDGSSLSLPRAVVWWCCFNPLLFSWPMAIVTALPLALVSRPVLGASAIVVFGALVATCSAAPLIALVSALVNPQRRAFHDRLVGIVAVAAG